MGNLVSILIPVYNREEFIGQTVASALCQTYEPIEVIVVDNNSTDHTWQILQELAVSDTRISIFRNATNVGPVRNWLRCINEGRGKYGKILWSDDLMHPQYLDITVPILEEDCNVGFVYSMADIFYEQIDMSAAADFDIKVEVLRAGEYLRDLLLDDLGKTFPVSPGCGLFRLAELQRNFVVDIPNHLNAEFGLHGIGPDLLILLMNAKDHARVVCVKNKLSFFRVHDKSITVMSDSIRLLLFYSMAKAYFVDHYIEDVGLRRAFNSKLLYELVRTDGFNQMMTNTREFYPGGTFVGYDLGWLVRRIVGKLLYRAVGCSK